jgi:uncharacterized surface protein with fasciclin (FAS1) repeats
MMLKRHHHPSLLSIVLALLAVIVLVCAQDNDAPLTETVTNGSEQQTPSNPATVNDQSILALLEANGAGIMAELLRTSETLSDIRQALNQPGQFTFFAPNDQAMQGHTSMQKKKTRDYRTWLQYLTLLKPMTLDEITSSHTKVVNTSLTSAQDTLKGKKVVKKDYVMALGKHGNDHLVWSTFPQSAAKVVKGNIRASNGILHIIDKPVEAPMTADWVLQNTPELSEFNRYITTLNMSMRLLHGETIFAPSNNAMLELPAQTWSSARQALAIQFHIMHGSFYTDNLDTGKLINAKTGASLNVTKVSDDEIFISGAKILVGDIITANGSVFLRYADAMIDPILY